MNMVKNDLFYKIIFTYLMICGNMCINSSVFGRKTIHIAEYSCKNDSGVKFWRTCPTGNSGIGRYMQ